jgi:hypothetical protein
MAETAKIEALRVQVLIDVSAVGPRGDGNGGPTIRLTFYMRGRAEGALLGGRGFARWDEQRGNAFRSVCVEGSRT